MLLLLAVALVTLFVVWVVTGVRLMLLARRTHALPEFLLGASLLLVAAFGFPLTELSRVVPAFHTPLIAVGSLCTSLGTALLFAFTALVFRRGERLAWVAVGTGSVLLAVQGVGNAVSQALATTPEDELAATLVWGAGSLVLTGAAWGWASFESLREHARLRKRLPLGLADPVVANRMLLFGGMGTIAVACVVVDACLLYLGGESARLIFLPLTTACAGLAVSVCMVLAFWPPAAYLERVRGRLEGARA
jgi:hypothetical protein